MDRIERRVWLSAKTITDLGSRTAQWLMGELQETPGHHGPPAGETAPFTATLVRLNLMGGAVTTQSQSGGAGAGWWQRPYVALLADPKVGEKLACDARAAGFMVAAYAPPFRRWRNEIADAIDVSFAYRKGTWEAFPDAGIKFSRSVLLGNEFGRACSAEAQTAVLAAHQIAIADLADHEPGAQHGRLWAWLDAWLDEQGAAPAPGPRPLKVHITNVYRDWTSALHLGARRAMCGVGLGGETPMEGSEPTCEACLSQSGRPLDRIGWALENFVRRIANDVCGY